ncbi:MAG: zinc ribbon domain-containing protein, partial [Acutalibacteraceae bacterium]
MLCPKCGKQIPDNAAVCKKCGEVFKVNNNNSQTLDYINKEKEKAQKRAEKLNEKQKSKSAKQKSKKPVNKRSVVLIIVAAVLVLAATAALLIHFDVISLPGQNKDEALKIEYTAEEVSDENAVMKLGDVNISDTEYSFFFHQSYSNIQNNAQLMFKEFMSKKLGDDFD